MTGMHALDETTWVLDLLREAGREAVTLDELEVVGVSNPGRALWELELAGHAVSRVFDVAAEGRHVTCVRLGERPQMVSPSPARRSLLAAGALGLLLLVIAASWRHQR
jgi:hypothetical protein